ncbi:MAG: cobyrinate a,c-diamide synthase [Nitrospirota bacterium]
MTVTSSFIIAGGASGSGKTTVSIGLMAALKRRGLIVQPFKAGPDYIDPIHHSIACGRPSYNLDTWMMGVDGVRDAYIKAMSGADIGVIEGVMGLYDGKDGSNEEGSTAHLAKVLNIGVILVIDASGMARSIAALVSGFESFDPGVKIAGVILNRVGSERHFAILKEALEKYCRAKVIGYMPHVEDLIIPERHLGLVIPNETPMSRGSQRIMKIPLNPPFSKGEIRFSPNSKGENKFPPLEKGGKGGFERLIALIEKYIDLNEVLKLGTEITTGVSDGVVFSTPSQISDSPRIAVAYDSAFCFYYSQNLDILRSLGAEIVFFSPMTSKSLPEQTTGIYLGGGYPELYAGSLEANSSLRNEIREFAMKGMPVYAECGGLMYLGKYLSDMEGKTFEMAGVFPWTSKMFSKLRSLGYREVTAKEMCPFLEKGQKIRGHEFHYSDITPVEETALAYRITGGKGRFEEGYLYMNTLASYVHLHFAGNPEFARGFVNKCRMAVMNPK